MADCKRHRGGTTASHDEAFLVFLPFRAILPSRSLSAADSLRRRRRRRRRSSARLWSGRVLLVPTLLLRMLELRARVRVLFGLQLLREGKAVALHQLPESPKLPRAGLP